VFSTACELQESFAVRSGCYIRGWEEAVGEVEPAGARLGTKKAANKNRARKTGDGKEKVDFKPSRTRTALVERLIRKLEERVVGKEEVKATVADLIRLLQLDQELAEKKPREIRVKWVEPGEEESVSET